MAINKNVLAEKQATVLSEDGNTMYATIQMRHGKESEMDKSKFVPAEMGVATDTKKMVVAFAPNDTKEVAFKDDLDGLINKNQGTENSGKVLVVGKDGNVIPGETPIEIDSTLTQSGHAADAKATGDKLSSLSEESDNVYNNSFKSIAEKNEGSLNADGHTFAFDDFELKEGEILAVAISNYVGSYYLGLRIYGVNYDGSTENITNVTIKQVEDTDYYYPVSKNYKGCRIWVRASSEESELSANIIIKSIPQIISSSFSQKSIITPQAFGAVGNGIADDSDAIQKAFNSNYGAIVFPDGNYLIQKKITDNVGHDVIMINSKIMVGNQFTDEYAFEINLPIGENYHRQYKYRLNVFCYYRSKCFIINSSRGNFYELVAKGTSEVLTIPENSKVYENEFNVHGENYDYQGEICVNNLRSDNIFNNIIAVNFRYAVVNNGNSYYKYIHPWLYGEVPNIIWETSTAFKDITNSAGGTVDYLYLDSVRYGIVGENYCRVNVNKIDVTFADVVAPSRLENNNIYIASGLNMNLNIGCINSYIEYKNCKIADDQRTLGNLIIQNLQLINWLTEAKISDIPPISLKITRYYANLFNSLPTEIQENYTDGSVFLEVSIIGSLYKSMYYRVNKLFISNKYPSQDVWKSISFDA